MAFVAALAALALAPGAALALLDEGRPACDYCRMIFDEHPLCGGEILTRSGARKIYDSMECMAAAVLTDSVPQRDIRAIALVDHAHPTMHVPLARAVLVHCPEMETPMGLSLVAFRTRADAQRACPSRAVRFIDWRGVLTHVDTTWFKGSLDVDRHVGAQGAKPRAAARR